MKRALIIDDSGTVRSIIAKMLRSMGIESIQAKDGQEAYSTLTENPDVLVAFVDWNMPIMNGLQFVHLVREQSGFQSLKLVMVTTETEIEQVTKALDAGADEYIMKPFTQEIFRDKLELIGIFEPEA